MSYECLLTCAYAKHQRMCAGMHALECSAHAFGSGHDFVQNAKGVQPFKDAVGPLHIDTVQSAFEHLPSTEKNSASVSISLNFIWSSLQSNWECLLIVPQFQMTDTHYAHSEITEKQRSLFQGVLCVSLKGRNMLVFCGHGKQADGCINKACWNIWSLLCIQLFNVFKEQL